MSFWDDLTKPLPGGTQIGNLLRKVGNDLSGGVLGNGAARITQIDYDIQNLTDEDYVAKYGKTKTGVPVAGVTPNPNIYAADQQLRGGINSQSSFWVTAKALAKRFWFLVIPAAVVILTWIVCLIKPNDKNNYSSKNRKRGK